MSNPPIVNIKPDSQGTSAVNVKWVRDFITNLIYKMNMNANKITNLPIPTDDDHAVNKQYTDT